ncbi:MULTISPECIES: Slp family lipoprotein [unclassified Lonepinella]|uniref:Slp family lipoprotein n=1 Tax=unclassified Lonepinella TaxID=2642006 RepID=UPI0036DE18AC
MKKILFFITALLLVGCVNPPQGLEKDEFTIQNLKDIDQDHYACQCKDVRLGGKVLSVDVLKNQTKIEVLSLQVSSFSAKPVLDSTTNGRFIAYLKGFVDPESLKDQYITVKGKLTGKEMGKIDQADYQYPVVTVQAFKQWQLVKEYYYEYDDWDYYPFGFGPRWGLMGRFWFAQPKVRYVLR